MAPARESRGRATIRLIKDTSQSTHNRRRRWPPPRAHSLYIGLVVVWVERGILFLSFLIDFIKSYMRMNMHKHSHLSQYLHQLQHFLAVLTFRHHAVEYFDHTYLLDELRGSTVLSKLDFAFRLPPNSNGRGRRAQNRISNTPRSLWVCSDAIWVD
jgi:hypothetical protein